MKKCNITKNTHIPKWFLIRNPSVSRLSYSGSTLVRNTFLLIEICIACNNPLRLGKEAEYPQDTPYDIQLYPKYIEAQNKAEELIEGIITENDNQKA